MNILFEIVAVYGGVMILLITGASILLCTCFPELFLNKNNHRLDGGE